MISSRTCVRAARCRYASRLYRTDRYTVDISARRNEPRDCDRYELRCRKSSSSNGANVIALSQVGFFSRWRKLSRRRRALFPPSGNYKTGFSVLTYRRQPPIVYVGYPISCLSVHLCVVRRRVFHRRDVERADLCTSITRATKESRDVESKKKEADLCVPAATSH